MSLPSELISQFAKITKDNNKKTNDATIYGTIVDHGGSKYVKLDGSELLTPISSTTNVENDERVTVTIKNHSAIVTGNISSPAARNEEVVEVGGQVTELSDQITELGVVVAEKVSTKDLEATNANIKNLVAENANIKNLIADKASIKDLEATNANIENLTAENADIKNLVAEKATIKDLDATNADIENLVAKDAEITGTLTAHKALIDDLETKKLTAESADIKYANVNFANIGEAAFKKIFADSGLIKDITIGDGTITGELVGVTIKGDVIEGNTVVADKLVVKGEDGLYYKLNTDGVSVEAEQTDYNSLNGSVITAKSITATKISVKDLVAFDATIGGFEITDNSINSVVKDSVDNTTRGIYMDNDGQIAFGDATNFVKFYKDTDGTYKLAIAASTLTFGGTNKSIEDAVNDALSDTVGDAVLDAVDNIEIGGRNLLTNSDMTFTAVGTGTAANFNTTIEEAYGISEKITQIAVEDEITLSVYLKMENAVFNGASRNRVGFELEINGSHYSCWFTPNVGEAVNYSGRVSTTSPAYAEMTQENGQPYLYIQGLESGTVTVSHPKLEKGNKATDWTPAPEDVDEDISNAEELASDAHDAANQNSARLNNALLDIDTINATLKSLVTGENGETLMTQTDNGWTLNIAGIQNTLNSVSSNVSDLDKDVSSAKSSIDSLNNAVADLGVYTDYIKFGTDNGQPCIILGETDSAFKVVITNTEIRFMEGSTIPAKISNQALNIKTAVVSGELQQGDYAWVSRANGHYSLIWKG